jgi:hypothetical protein
MSLKGKKPGHSIEQFDCGEASASIMQIKTATLNFCVCGDTPIVLNRLSEKAKQMLLLPRRKSNRAGLEQTLKHNPIEEYRASVYSNKMPDAPTRILLPGGSFKRSLADAALDMPGAAKATIGRLTTVRETMIDLYGVPSLMMAVVRQAGIVKSPDIRTRAVIKDWACRITVRYVSSVISQDDVTNLLAAAGVIIGVGDWRPQKGAGSYGMFRLCNDEDPDYRNIVRTGGREAQDAALNAEEPAFFDADSEDLFVWYAKEVAKRAAEPESAFRGRKDRLPIDGQDLAEELVAASTLTGSAPRKGNGRRRHV